MVCSLGRIVRALLCEVYTHKKIIIIIIIIIRFEQEC